MSYKAWSWLTRIDPTRCDAGAHRVLFQLCHHHNDGRPVDRACYPTQASLSTSTGFTHSAVNRALSRLEEARLISRVRGSVPGCRMQRTYYLLECDAAAPPEDQSGVDATLSKSRGREFDASQSSASATDDQSPGRYFDGGGENTAVPSKSRGQEFDTEQSNADALSKSRPRDRIIKEIYTTTTTDSADHAEALHRRCLEVCGPGLCEQSRAAIGASADVILGWVEGGADLEEHILPVLRYRTARDAGRVIQSWGYFSEAVAARRAGRSAPAAVRVAGRAAPVAASQNASRKHVSGGASESEVLEALAAWVVSDRYMPPSAVNNRQRDALLARGLVTREQLRARQIY